MHILSGLGTPARRPRLGAPVTKFLFQYTCLRSTCAVFLDCKKEVSLRRSSTTEEYFVTLSYNCNGILTPCNLEVPFTNANP